MTDLSPSFTIVYFHYDLNVLSERCKSGSSASPYDAPSGTCFMDLFLGFFYLNLFELVPGGKI